MGDDYENLEIDNSFYDLQEKYEKLQNDYVDLKEKYKKLQDDYTSLKNRCIVKDIKEIE